MDRTHIHVIYDGEAVDDGEMDIGQLASSLLALGKLVEATDAIISGESNRIKVRVKSDMKRGSFDVGIVVAIDNLWDAAKTWIISPEGMTVGFLLSVLGFNARDGVTGLIQAVRWLNGRRIAKKIILEDGNTRIETDDGEQLVLEGPVARIVDEPQVRQSLEKFTDPLRDDGVESIRLESSSGRPAEVISADEETAFKATGASDPTSVSRFEATYQIKRLYFEQGKKWRLSNGTQAILAEIEDSEFWERVGRSEVAFAANDYLLCMVRMDQWLGPNGLKTEYAVEKVLRHIPAPKQVDMF